MTAKSNKPADLPHQIRVSLGTAIVLGLLYGKLDAEPTTAYLMTYKIGKCTANCGFCPQARDSQSKAEMLSRISWPTFSSADILTALGKSAKDRKIKRVCIQALNYPGVFLHLQALARGIKEHADIPVSVSCQPLIMENIQLLAEAGVNRIGIALDASTKSLFSRVKGSDAGGYYSWDNQISQLKEAVRVFGKGNVSTHLIVGLGETEKEAVQIIQECVDMDVLPALFAFTPVRGTTLEKRPPPLVEKYRRIQLARYLIVKKSVTCKDMRFDDEGKIASFGLDSAELNRIIESGTPFQTSGCPDCNRPFYNEKPSGPIYNYPKKLSAHEIELIKQQLNCLG